MQRNSPRVFSHLTLPPKVSGKVLLQALLECCAWQGTCLTVPANKDARDRRVHARWVVTMQGSAIVRTCGVIVAQKWEYVMHKVSVFPRKGSVHRVNSLVGVSSECNAVK